MRSERDGRSSDASAGGSSTATGSASRPNSTRGSTAGYAPLGLVNDVLLGAMKEVGELFASGDMQLPFVLRSAETMKASVAYLEPMMERSEVATRGSIVLGTVAGDVHDIGKNLVDIILTNNGFEVHNLGIKVDIGELIDAYERTQSRRHRDERSPRQEHAGDARQPRRADSTRPRFGPRIAGRRCADPILRRA